MTPFAHSLGQRWRRRLRLRNQRGQTLIEWLALMAMTFIAAFVVISGPVSSYSLILINRVRSAIVNVVQNADLRPGQQIEPGEAGHPSDRSRGKRLH